MENILNILSSQFGQQEASAIASKVGVNTEDVNSLVQSFLPVLTQGLARNANQSSGAESLLNALNQKHTGSILNNISSAMTDETSNDGMKILGHVFGSKTNLVQQFFNKGSNLDNSQINQIIQLATPILMGMLGSKVKQSNFNATSLTALLTSSISQATEQNPNNMGLVNQLLDQDGDGSISDDLANTGLNMLKSWMSNK
ncbi:DUF937 domain-containing protein [bacterium]|nr:DUF937 domain-containing protein [bacterium]